MPLSSVFLRAINTVNSRFYIHAAALARFFDVDTARAYIEDNHERQNRCIARFYDLNTRFKSYRISKLHLTDAMEWFMRNRMNRVVSHEACEIGNRETRRRSCVMNETWAATTKPKPRRLLFAVEATKRNKRVSNGLLSDRAACLIYVNTLIKLFYVLLTEDYWWMNYSYFPSFSSLSRCLIQPRASRFRSLRFDIQFEIIRKHNKTVYCGVEGKSERDDDGMKKDFFPWCGEVD